MNLKNWLTLTVRAQGINIVAKQPDLIAKLRKLTLAPYSGMNFELNWMLEEAQERFVDCYILLGYVSDELVSWALLSKEDSDFVFCNAPNGFKGSDGWMFQVFVSPDYRRRGIGSELYKAAQKLAGDETLCVCPWDDRSSGFYDQFPDVNRRDL